MPIRPITFLCRQSLFQQGRVLGHDFSATLIRRATRATAASVVPERFHPRTIKLRRRFTSSTTDDNGILEAEVIRESSSSISSRHRKALEKAARDEIETLQTDLMEALQGHEKLVETSSSDPLLIQASLVRLRDCYEGLADWEAALRVHQALMEDHLEQSPAEGVIDLAAGWYHTGKLHMRLHQLTEANRSYQKALDLYQRVYGESSHHADVGNLLLSMAGIHFHRGRLDEALAVLEEAEPHFLQHTPKVDSETSKEPPLPHVDIVKCLKHKGLVCRTMPDFQSALVYYQQALQVLEEIAMEGAEAQREQRLGLQMDIADMHSALEEYDRALEVYQSVLDASRLDTQIDATQVPDALEGVILHSMGRIHAEQNRTEEAKVALQRAVEIKCLHAGEFHPEVAKTLNVLGAVQAVSNDKSKALESFKQALLICRMHAATETDENVMYALRNIAVLKGEKVPKWGATAGADDL